MKQLATLILILGGLLLGSCSAQFRLMGYDRTNQVSAQSMQSSFENYENSVKIDTLNEFQFRNRLRTDINFRLDFAKYALSQPQSFDWNNRLLGRSYDSRWNSYYWNRTQVWNDWAWGYTGWNSWGSPHRWSPFGYDRWGYGIHYGWNNHGWGHGWNNYNGYYNNGWPYYGNNVYNSPYWGRSNVYYGRRTTTRNGRAQSSMIEANKRKRRATNTRVNTRVRNTNNSNNTLQNNTTPRNNNTKIKPIRNTPSTRIPTVRPSNNRVIKNNPPRRTAPVIRNNNSTPRRSTTPSRTTRKRNN